MMDQEQTWPTEEELQEAEQRTQKRRVPKGESRCLPSVTDCSHFLFVVFLFAVTIAAL